ncbi:YlbF family regulator [Risungbinella massiliensis]|uniref:YlbF family regulator n=1 Tax=Risungbinella massiliensis TaxID=1329796 RepID=UPI0005CC9026|nr:YlbF family regulator [Risungbinella massiliensis]
MTISTIPSKVLVTAHQFALKLQNSAEIERFRLAEQQVDQSLSVQNLIQTIKKKQKELVHAKHYQKTEYRKCIEQELDQLNKKLDNLPIVREYQQSQVEVNEIIQTIQQILADAISEKIEVEAGGEIVSGCGSGGPCGCR